jgi:hypothetical protein
MSKKTTKPEATVEAQLLVLLRRVLPKATHDPEIAGKIYDAVEQELRRKSRASAFDKFCARVELPDLESKTVTDVKRQFEAAFDEGDVTIKPRQKEQCLAVEVSLPDGSQYQSEIKVRPVAAAEDGESDAPPPKFAPFPVSLPGDKELVWLLAKRESMTPEEAGITLSKLEEEFWSSKTGQKLLRDRVERSFPEFIVRAPAGLLSEAGLKRHYKMPEPLKVLRR